MTVRELIYMVLDEIKSTIDDSFITEEHVLFLVKKYRILLLKQRYSDIKKHIPESNYQTICVDLEEDLNEICIKDAYLKSVNKIPFILKIGNTTIYPIDYYDSNITFISRDRMKYIGYNKYMKNIIYASLGPDSHLYLKSNNPQFIYLKKVKLTGIFEDFESAIELQCEEDNPDCCKDLYDNIFPIEENLIPDLIKLTVQELLGVQYRPEDSKNDSTDNLSNLEDFIRRNMSQIAKQNEGQ